MITLLSSPGRTSTEAAWRICARKVSIRSADGAARTFGTNTEREHAAKKLVCPEWSLRKWTQDGLASKPWPELGLKAAAAASNQLQRLTLSQNGAARTDDLLDLRRPAVLQGSVDEWPALGRSSWSVEAMTRELSEYEFIIGATLEEEEGCGSQAEQQHEDGEGYGTVGGDIVPVRMKLSDFIEYSHRQKDDCPLYIFDEACLDDPLCESLSSSYSTPSPLCEDFLSLLGPERPPYKWLLVGAARAGTALHVDPLQTSAWNTLVSGSKRWVLFPPEVEAHQVFRTESATSLSEDLADSASHWLHHCYPNVDELAASKCIDFVQHPGETVYVPNGWWHNVVNLEFSIAVTQNFVGMHNAGACYEAMLNHDCELAMWWRDLAEASGEHELLLQTMRSQGQQVT